MRCVKPSRHNADFSWINRLDIYFPNICSIRQISWSRWYVKTCHCDLTRILCISSRIQPSLLQNEMEVQFKWRLTVISFIYRNMSLSVTELLAIWWIRVSKMHSYYIIARTACKNVHGFFHTDFHEVIWHFCSAIVESFLRSSEIMEISVKEPTQNVFCLFVFCVCPALVEHTQRPKTASETSPSLTWLGEVAGVAVSSSIRNYTKLNILKPLSF